MYVYNQNDNKKPEIMHTFMPSMAFKEVRKADVGGKMNVFRVDFGTNSEYMLLSGASYDSVQRWIKALDKLKQELNRKQEESSSSDEPSSPFD